MKKVFLLFSFAALCPVHIEAMNGSNANAADNGLPPAHQLPGAPRLPRPNRAAIKAPLIAEDNTPGAPLRQRQVAQFNKNQNVQPRNLFQ
jgi:hypothetical protein